MNAKNFPVAQEAHRTARQKLAFYRSMQAALVAAPLELRSQELGRLRPGALRFAIARTLSPDKWVGLHRRSLKGEDLDQMLDALVLEADATASDAG